ncbi:hypothetical protein GCM10010280_56390 [Streptomyces pilosus]|uniref:Uncharacterized protein n=2 Tax=Streptomyces pilosus TaxID=28893 RepID=A0A918C2E2_9ACTN|nr:hypothetical protein GCM10010280_56390 [Streptomyces pilosus]
MRVVDALPDRRPMGILTTCLISLAAVNIAMWLIRSWRRSVEARAVAQVRAWPGLDIYHAELLSSGQRLCSTDHQPGDLERNSCRAAAVAVRLMRQEGLIDESTMKVVPDAVEPTHPVTAAAFRCIDQSYINPSELRTGDVGRDSDFQAAVRAHLKELFVHAPTTRRHPATTTVQAAMWTYGIGAAAPAVHVYLLLSSSAPGDPDTAKGSFVVAFLVFVVALIVLTAQAGNTWHPLEDTGVPAGLRELSPPQQSDLPPARG